MSKIRNKKMEEMISQMSRDPILRRSIVKKSHFWFFHFYLNEYIHHKLAPFQREMLQMTEKENPRTLAVMAFRDSGKSIIMNLSYPLWAILGVQQKKFVLIISKSHGQAKTHFSDLCDELKHNKLLKSDLGPFNTGSDDLGPYSLELPRLGAKIVAFSKGQSIRGSRYGSIRPDLIICDDVEDTFSVKEERDRNNCYEWFASEVMPLGDQNTRVVVLGNLLHEKSLLMRLRDNILNGELDGLFKAYPLLDDNDVVLWPGKFSTLESVQRLRKSMPDKHIWEREYLLQIKDPKIIVIFRLRNRGDPPLPEEPEEKKKESLAIIRPDYSMKDYVISAPVIGPDDLGMEIIYERGLKKDEQKKK